MIAGNSSELEPWLIVMGSSPNTTLALWRIEARKEESVAIFSSRALSETYAKEHCSQPFELLHMDQTRLIRVFADCFQRGIQFATLNPSNATAQQIFVLRDVLKAARAALAKPRDQPDT